jgi:hypothetical protein
LIDCPAADKPEVKALASTLPSPAQLITQLSENVMAAGGDVLAGALTPGLSSALAASSPAAASAALGFAAAPAALATALDAGCVASG